MRDFLLSIKFQELTDVKEDQHLKEEDETQVVEENDDNTEFETNNDNDSNQDEEDEEEMEKRERMQFQENPEIPVVKQRSLVWKYFRKTLPALASCNLCGKEICTVGNNTSGMIKHLTALHYELNFQVRDFQSVHFSNIILIEGNARGGEVGQTSKKGNAQNRNKWQLCQVNP